MGLLTRFLDLGSEMVAFILIGVIALSVVQIGQPDVSYVMLYSVWNEPQKGISRKPVLSSVPTQSIRRSGAPPLTGSS